MISYIWKYIWKGIVKKTRIYSIQSNISGTIAFVFKVFTFVSDHELAQDMNGFEISFFVYADDTDSLNNVMKWMLYKKLIKTNLPWKLLILDT